MINIINKKKCSGCSACSKKCPVNAITMKTDDEGFDYPDIDVNKCINCNLCVKVCPFRSDVKQKEKPKYIYAVKNRDNHIRTESSSGGVFIELCRYIISMNGCVYGAAFDSKFCVIHKSAETLDECKAFQGSKYVQSKIGNTFINIKALLSQGKYVLFSGTPCQVAGLKNYLGEIDTTKLFTCDIICHGVPSPLIWKKYLEYVSCNDNITKISFRSKNNGWHHSELQIDGEKIHISQNHGENPYSLLYFNHYTLRPSCSICPFASMYREGDITIGDFWNIEKTHPEIDDDNGISLVMINSDKGEKIFEEVSKQLIVVSSDEHDCFQANLKEPSKLNSNRTAFWNCYYKHGLPHTIKVFTSYGDNDKIIKIERRIIKCKNRIKGIWSRINDRD